MITIKATIDLLEGDTRALQVDSITTPKNNNSSEISATVGLKTNGSNPFMLGVTKFNTQPSFKSSVPYYISNQISDSNGNFPENTFPVLIIEYGNEAYANNITINFDTYNKRYAKTIIINGKTYTNDDPIFTVTDLDDSPVKKIYFKDWSEPNHPLVIQSLSLGIKIDVDKRVLVEYNGVIEDRADVSSTSWGIISNTGNISFIDRNYEVYDYANDNLLVEGLDVSVFIVNTINNKIEKIGSFKTKDWNYDNDNRQVSVSLENDLPEWQDINLQEYTVDPTKIEEKSLEYIYRELHSKTPQRFNMLSFEELDEATKNHLSSSFVRYFVLEKGTLWNGWEKFCQVAQTHIYKNKEGITICRYDRGN